jgi:two-component system NtrC family response regulator
METGDGGNCWDLMARVRLYKLRAARRALRKTRGNISQACKVLGVSRPTLYEILRNRGGKRKVKEISHEAAL